jgi:hypothetical protein
MLDIQHNFLYNINVPRGERDPREATEKNLKKV